MFKVVAVDTFTGSAEHQESDVIKEGILRQRFECNILRFPELASHVHVLQLPSIRAAPLFADRSVDVVFIDGDHGAQAVLYDLCVWHRKVRRGGILAGHDMVPGSGVYFAVKTFTAILGIPMPHVLRPTSHYLFIFYDWDARDMDCF